MHSVTYQSIVGAPREFVWSTYLRNGQFDRLVPPWQRVTTIRQAGGVEPGGFRELQLQAGPFKLSWLAVHERYDEGRRFTDRQVRGPFRYWRHQHHFSDQSDAGCLIRDEIDYELPVAPVSQVLGDVVRAELRRMFRYRHFTTFHDMHELYRSRSSERRTVVVNGAPSVVLVQLRAFLDLAGHTVLVNSPTANSPQCTTISLSSADGGRVLARIVPPNQREHDTQVVQSSPILVPESPLLRLARAFQFFATSHEQLARPSLEWTTVDDFVCAIHRSLLDPRSGRAIYVRHPQPARFNDLVEALSTGENKPRLGRPPEALIGRCRDLLDTLTEPAARAAHEQIELVSRYQTLREAVQTMTGHS